MNILVISHVYPGGGTPQSFTPVVHYFAREWVKQGHKVIVVNLSTYFPSIVYHLPSFVKKYLVNKFQFALPEKRLNKAIDFNYEGVDVIRVPIFKYKPSMVVSYKRQTKQADYIIAKLQERGFVPDVAVGHWQNPLYILSRIKTHYGCGTAMVLHGSVSFDRYPNWRDLTSQIDLWGLRSVCMTEAFDKLMGAGAPRFICASGTPQSIVNPEADLMRWNDRYIYVGFLLDRKYPDVVIKTLPKVYGRNDYHLDVVGGGFIENQLHALIKQLDEEQRINMTGRKPREEVIRMLDKADCFIMISRDEVFGLVYLEAMARGCIVVASRGEGMMGIIEDGVNGFLCAAGSENELAQIVQKIRSLTSEDRLAIRRAAMKTASEYTDWKVAERYAEQLSTIKKSL